MLEPKEKELDSITEEAVNYLDRIEKLNKDLENAENTYYSMKGKLDNANKRIKELEKETHEQSMNFEGLLTLLDDSKNRINELERALWLARADRAETKYRFLRYTWCKLNQMAKPDKPLIEEIKKDFSKWANVERKCRAMADKFKDNKQTNAKATP